MYKTTATIWDWNVNYLPFLHLTPHRTAILIKAHMYILHQGEGPHIGDRDRPLPIWCPTDIFCTPLSLSLTDVLVSLI